jgi:phosphoribosylformylglycinamidine synthase subunit PurS
VKAKVYVTLKRGVLDPQGKAIQHSAGLLGYGGVQDVRQGKYFEIALDDSAGEADARRTAEQLARDVLRDDVIGVVVAVRAGKDDNAEFHPSNSTR